MRIVFAGTPAVAVVAYGALVPQAALDIPPHGWINLHFSLLPAWRGAAPVQRAIWGGDQITGATTFQIVRELDAGPILGMMTYAVPPRATAGDVLEALAADGSRLLVATMDSVASGEARPEPQGSEGVSYADKVTAEDARVDWSAPATAVDRQVRACTPEPGAWTTFRGGRLKLGPVTPLDRDAPMQHARFQLWSSETGGKTAIPGRLLATKFWVMAGTATGPVFLSDVTPAGKVRMDAVAWARGVRIDYRDRLGQ
jgi:methionyl-tRNA formyltransferase